MNDPEATARPADATAELAHYAEKYRDVHLPEQFDLLMAYAKALAAETGSASLTTSEISWLYRSVGNGLSIVPTPQPGMVTVSVEDARHYESVLDDYHLRNGETREQIGERITRVRSAIAAAEPENA
jgi:hypothetical protein